MNTIVEKVKRAALSMQSCSFVTQVENPCLAFASYVFSQLSRCDGASPERMKL